MSTQSEPHASSEYTHNYMECLQMFEKEKEVEIEVFKSIYSNRYRYIPSHKDYHPIPLSIQLPSKYTGVYNTEYIYVPEDWDHKKRKRFIDYITTICNPLRSRI